jgi:dolichyl-phosphate-mannose-protein mannosyltransferase
MLDIMNILWRKLTKYPELIIIILVALLTRFWELFTPNAVVFDEVYFKAFAGHYLDGRYFFDIHPPLAKLIFAGWAHILGLSASSLTDGTAVALRVIPAFAGVMIIPIFWGILRRLGTSRRFAFLGTLALLLDSALIVESRFILMDSLLLMFGLGAIYCYLVFQQKRTNWRWLWIILAASSAGAALSIKWTGMTALALLLLLWFGDLMSNLKKWPKRLLELGVLIIIPVLLYVGCFWIHLELLPHSGDGDAFMSTNFQATLIDNPNHYKNAHMTFAKRFIELNHEMLSASQTLTATHPYGSRWYTWPLEIRSVYYWQGEVMSDGKQGNIYLLGNPVVWWGVVIAVIAGILTLIIGHIKLPQRTQLGLSLLLIAYLINFVPFMAVTRVMFLYHYFYSFIFSLAAVCVLWDSITTILVSEGQLTRRTLLRSLGLVSLVIILGFLYFAPLTYGTPLSPSELQAHMWLRSWR